MTNQQVYLIVSAMLWVATAILNKQNETSFLWAFCCFGAIAYWFKGI